jgi:hypothetical protein
VITITFAKSVRLLPNVLHATLKTSGNKCQLTELVFAKISTSFNPTSVCPVIHKVHVRIVLLQTPVQNAIPLKDTTKPHKMDYVYVKADLPTRTINA